MGTNRPVYSQVSSTIWQFPCVGRRPFLGTTRELVEIQAKKETNSLAEIFILYGVILIRLRTRSTIWTASYNGRTGKQSELGEYRSRGAHLYRFL